MDKGLNNTRNFGIDLLRLVLMFNIVVTHMLLYGVNMETLSGNMWRAARLLYTISVSAVDCFALISGYVGYREKERINYSKYLHFWTQVFFYSFTITFIFFVAGQGNSSDLFESAFPISFGKYWYATAYTGVFFLSPWINKLIRSCNKREADRFVLMVLCLFCIYGIVVHRMDPFKLNEGYSVLWLAVLYAVGAWIKKNEINKVINQKAWLKICVASILCVWIIYIFIPVGRASLVRYISIVTVLIAICRVSFYSLLRINDRVLPIIKHLSPAAFGVYLIHEHHCIRSWVMAKWFAWLATMMNPILFFMAVLLCSFAVYIVCLGIEILRRYLFRITKIDTLINCGQRIIEQLCEKLIRRINY